ncbi:MAG: hypothetical protein HYY24_30355 [Verrucomicrobia bacterium]|nr:hypothetical protein [Verrucomicrobiota bacterium]
MPIPPKQMEGKINKVVGAWETLRADKSFAGMTLTQFKNKVRGSLDTRTTIDTLESQLTAARSARDDADKASNDAILLAVNAVKGDDAEGEDGELYEAMGYVRKSERKSGLTRKTNGETNGEPKPPA